MLRLAGLCDTVITFYNEFPLEWRTNSTLNLLLGILYLFNAEVPELNNPIAIAVENMKYQSLLKRYVLINFLCIKCKIIDATKCATINFQFHTCIKCAVVNFHTLHQMFNN